MSRNYMKFIFFLNLICLPINVSTFYSGWNAWNKGDHANGAFFMLIGVLCFIWVGLIVIQYGKRLLKKD